MLISRQVSKSLLALTGLFGLLVCGAVRADDQTGVVRIADTDSNGSESTGAANSTTPSQEHGQGVVYYDCDAYCCGCNRSSDVLGFGLLERLFGRFGASPSDGCCSDYERCNHLHGREKLACELNQLRRRKNIEKGRFNEYLKARFGYFIPSGCCEGGCSPVGKWQMVYALNPYHIDQRDGRVFAAATTGVPMVIPVAPTVRHTYNYSTGMPASRITDMSRIVPPKPY